MNRQQILLALAMAEAGLPIDVSRFDQRLIIQKAVCLMQDIGVHLGYRFRWYLRGPYSTDLASDAFFLAGNGQEISGELSRWSLDKESKAKITALKDLFSGTSVAVLAKTVELLASIVFLIRTRQANTSDPREIARILKLNGKSFTAVDVEKACGQLRQHGFKL